MKLYLYVGDFIFVADHKVGVVLSGFLKNIDQILMLIYLNTILSEIKFATEKKYWFEKDHSLISLYQQHLKNIQLNENKM